MKKIINTSDKDFDSQFNELLNIDRNITDNVEDVVRSIVQDVKSKGDNSLVEYTNKFDKKLDESMEPIHQNVSKETSIRRSLFL